MLTVPPIISSVVSMNPFSGTSISKMVSHKHRFLARKVNLMVPLQVLTVYCKVPIPVLKPQMPILRGYRMGHVRFLVRDYAVVLHLLVIETSAWQTTTTTSAWQTLTA